MLLEREGLHFFADFRDVKSVEKLQKHLRKTDNQ
jgi:hypothetical protein